jgi:hypothetical protein
MQLTFPKLFYPGTFHLINQMRNSDFYFKNYNNEIPSYTYIIYIYYIIYYITLCYNILYYLMLKYIILYIT